MSAPIFNTLRIKSSNNHLTEHRDAILRQLDKLDLYHLGLTLGDGFIELEVDGRDIFKIVTELHTFGNWFGA